MHTRFERHRDKNCVSEVQSLAAEKKATVNAVGMITCEISARTCLAPRTASIQDLIHCIEIVHHFEAH